MHDASSFGVASEEVRPTRDVHELDPVVRRRHSPTGDVLGERLPVGPLVEDVIARVERLSAVSRVEVFVHSNLGTLTGDCRAIADAIHQLLVDAVLATPAGAAIFFATYQCDDGSQYWTLRDMGSGLTDDRRQGILLAKDVVERHGGHASVECETGHGALISLWFPYREEARAPASAAEGTAR